MWLGSQSSDVEKKQAPELARAFVAQAAKVDKRDADTPVIVVH